MRWADLGPGTDTARTLDTTGGKYEITSLPPVSARSLGVVVRRPKTPARSSVGRPGCGEDYSLRSPDRRSQSRRGSSRTRTVGQRPLQSSAQTFLVLGWRSVGSSTRCEVGMASKNTSELRLL